MLKLIDLLVKILIKKLNNHLKRLEIKYFKNLNHLKI